MCIGWYRSGNARGQATVLTAKVGSQDSDLNPDDGNAIRVYNLMLPISSELDFNKTCVPSPQTFRVFRHRQNGIAPLAIAPVSLLYLQQNQLVHESPLGMMGMVSLNQMALAHREEHKNQRAEAYR